MFEHIHFMVDEKIDELSQLIKLPNQQEKLEHFISEHPENLQAMKGNVEMEGHIRVLFQLPMPKDHMEHLLYLQSFSWLNMGSQYFTHRKNYDSYLLLYTYNGCGKLDYEGESYELHPGDGFFIDCKKEHTYHTIGDIWEHSDFHINGDMADFLFSKLFADHSPIFHCPLQGEYQKQLEKVLQYNTSSNPKWEFYTSSAIHELIMLVFSLKTVKEKKAVSPDYIIYLKRYLECHFTSDLSIDDMADFCGVSKYHMIRQFKNYTNFTPKEYVTVLRIARAKQLLIDTNIASYKIGIMVGIENEANFIRTFKINTGMTPTEYRRNHV